MSSLWRKRQFAWFNNDLVEQVLEECNEHDTFGEKDNLLGLIMI